MSVIISALYLKGNGDLIPQNRPEIFPIIEAQL